MFRDQWGGESSEDEIWQGGDRGVEALARLFAVEQALRGDRLGGAAPAAALVEVVRRGRALIVLGER